MAAMLIAEQDLIEVANPPILVFGSPGSGKTSLAQTADKPLTLDFDRGAHRSAFRKTTLRFESWEDVQDVQNHGLRTGGAFTVEPQFANFTTINLDTIGSLLRFMARSLIDGNAKLGTRMGGLSQQGYGALKGKFDAWLDNLRNAGKQVVMIAHEKEEKDGDTRLVRPDITGGSYSIVMQAADIVGYLTYRNNKRFIAWDPTDAYFAKNGAQLKSGPVPLFSDVPDFLAQVLTEAKGNLGRTAMASAAVAKAVEEWQKWLAADPKLEDVNAKLGEVGKLRDAPRNQVVHLIRDQMNKSGYVYDKTAKKYVAKPEAA